MPPTIPSLLSSLSLSLLLAGVAHAAPQQSQQSALGTVDVVRYPAARCNNGDAATYNYLLSTDAGPGADGVDHRKKWLVILSGGGGCTDLVTCSARWREASIGPNLDGGPGDHENMVADQTARKFNLHGILDFDGQPAQFGPATVGATANPFRGPAGADGFNRVWINYCSSDGWSGLGTDVPVAPADFPVMPFDPSHPALSSLHFGGAKIVDAVIATIMRGQITGAARPDLVPDAVDGELVLAGSSAGGAGTIRNLDTVARDVAGGVAGEFAAVPEVRVYGIPDAATAVGPVATPSGADAYAIAQFYSNVVPADPPQVRTDDGCVDNADHRCYTVGVHVVANEITTPYFVVQQAFDQQIHANLKVGIAEAIAAAAPTLALQYPGIYAFLAGQYPTAGAAAEAYIRWSVTTHAADLGLALGNPAGLFIPNYAAGWHQLIADSERFYTSEAEQWVGGTHPGSPELGGPYVGTTVSIPTALANFRQCVLGNYGGAASYAACVSTIDLVNVGGNARVINATAP